MVKTSFWPTGFGPMDQPALKSAFLKIKFFVSYHRYYEASTNLEVIPLTTNHTKLELSWSSKTEKLHYTLGRLLIYI